VQIMRAPLTTLDNSLDDTQRKHFNAIVLKERPHKKLAQANADTLADLCSGQAKNFTNLPTTQIEQTIKPSGQQQTAALNALKDASAKAASSVESSCPSAMPQSLSDRFNAIVKRLDAMAGAVKTVEPALKELYSSLSDDQKARFNVMQPPSDAQTPRG
jgi:small-conductance mechanosensitive channel